MIVVVGSLNLDLVARVRNLPAEGETVLATGYAEHPGGKGANQAVAAARAGAPVRMVGRIGGDDAGRLLRDGLVREGVDVREVVDVEAPTGRAWIEVDDAGRNRIVVVQGANAVWEGVRWELDTVFGSRHEPSSLDIVVLQREVPDAVLAEVAGLAHRAQARVLLNAAPAGPLPDALRPWIDTLVVNEHEAAQMLGAASAWVAAEPRAAVKRLGGLGIAEVALTLGAEGAVYLDGDEVGAVPGFVVEVVDTTAAGDAFVGAYATLRGEGATVREATEFAVAAGAEAVRSPGAQPSLPTRSAIERRLKTR